jgi:hypothetical protein
VTGRSHGSERGDGAAGAARPWGVEVVAAPEAAPPFAPEGVVAEEDAFLVLSAEPDVREPSAPRVRVFHEAYSSEPAEPGSVVVRDGAPVRLLAVVHDLSKEPSWREEWVASALEATLGEAEARGLRTLAMPLLGRVHGGLALDAFVSLLRETLERCAPPHLERLWLITPESDLEELQALLASNLFR